MKKEVPGITKLEADRCGFATMQMCDILMYSETRHMDVYNRERARALFQAHIKATGRVAHNMIPSHGKKYYYDALGALKAAGIKVDALKVRK